MILGYPYFSVAQWLNSVNLVSADCRKECVGLPEGVLLEALNTVGSMLHFEEIRGGVAEGHFTSFRFLPTKTTYTLCNASLLRDQRHGTQDVT